MDKESIMIRNRDGYYWLNTLDAEGRQRSSCLGRLGSASGVAMWCENHGVEFREVGTASAHKAPVAAQRRVRSEAGRLVRV